MGKVLWTALGLLLLGAVIWFVLLPILTSVGS